MKLIGKFALAWMLTVSPLASQTVLAQESARRPETIRPAFPEIALAEREATGQRAVDLLGARLPSVAAWYGKSADEFRRKLLGDKTLRIDRRGRLFVVEELPKPGNAPAAPSAPGGVLDGQLQPLDQTFLLHSKPGSNRTLVLNFKGAVLSGTAWNTTSSPINAPAFDFDGNAAVFSNAELERIQYIWQRVAEDYAVFDIDVTTEIVAQDKITRSGSTDQIYGTTALITAHAGVYTCSCGGVAYVGVFNSTSDYLKPALVFYDSLGAGNEKYVSEAISHEVGHNIGLSHDGNATVGYYQGQGTGVTGWAPIMGVGYYRPLSQFSKGEYAGANNKEDDFAVAQSYGLPLRADDYGNTTATAAPLAGNSSGGITTATADGVVESAGDADVFVLSAGVGPLTIALSPANRAPNADLELTLLSSTGSLLATQNPADTLNAALSYQVVTPGTYYLMVKGTGKDDPLVTGYTSYGSVGLYGLTASYATGGGSAPVASFTNSTESGTAPVQVQFNASASSDSDGSIALYNWDFGDGSTSTGVATYKVFGTAGTFDVQLRVTDNDGMSSTTSTAITVTNPSAPDALEVYRITMRLKAAKSGNANASGTIKVVDDGGLPVAGASVAAIWSGAVSGSVSANTDSKGLVTFNSPATKAAGCFTLAVSDVTKSGYLYNSTTSVQSSQICR